MLWICTHCTTAYSVEAPRCPHCGSTAYVEQGSADHGQWLAVQSKHVKPKPDKADKPGKTSSEGTSDADG